MEAEMSSVSSESATGSPPVKAGEVRLEVVVVPVSDVDRAKSACSIIFGKGVTSAPTGSSEALQLTIYDIDEAPADLIGRGVDVSEPFHDETGVFHHGGTQGRLSGPAPGRADYGSFAALSDPDGNGWLLQEIKRRLPGR